ncbi:MAG: hypothetical protein JWR26_2023 [Pedosphaera sp.]|nr:hypothetical protein [Pedosphaera sp.]
MPAKHLTRLLRIEACSRIATAGLAGAMLPGKLSYKSHFRPHVDARGTKRAAVSGAAFGLELLCELIAKIADVKCPKGVTHSLLRASAIGVILKDKTWASNRFFVQNIDIKKFFGASVRGWRRQLGISQETLAEKADLHRTYVSDVERGSRNLSLESIGRLAHALEVSIAELFPPTEASDDMVFTVTNKGQGGEQVEVLLVEDDPDDVQLTLMAFRSARFANRVRVVNDGEEALDYIFCRAKFARRRATERPQVILLDLNLPKIGGVEVLRRIRADKSTQTIPVVVLTASRRGSDIAECRRLGVESYITKPVNFQGLSRVTPQLNLDWVLMKPAPTKPGNVQT